MSEDRITLELLGARLLALTAEVRDLQQRFAGMEARLGALETRFSAMEARFSAMETRFAVQEERMGRMLDLIVRIAERQGGVGSQSPPRV
jgi:chromosome segregation ATPase